MSHLLRLIIEQIQQILPPLSICFLLQIREPLLIKLVKNVITHQIVQNAKLKM